MKPEGHLEIYRVALASATAELNDIGAELERLRVRKEQVERLVVVLEPLAGGEQAIEEPEAAQMEPGPNPEETPVEVVVESKEEPVGVGPDPFQRRVDHVLGIGGGIRDVRSFTRQY